MVMLLGLLPGGCASIDYEPASFKVANGKIFMNGVIDHTTPNRVGTILKENPDINTFLL